jgi:hypothetical protein
MSWFKHRHSWNVRSDLQRVTTTPGAEKPQYCFYVEDCRCGAVRTVELKPGEAPAIRMTEAPKGTA